MAESVPELELTTELRWILGRPCFWCARYADVLRFTGIAIEHKAEDEQAVVIHWMLTLYKRHGAEKWREFAEAFLTETVAKMKAESSPEVGKP